MAVKPQIREKVDEAVQKAHWAKVHKIIRDEKSKSIAIYDLAEKLHMEPSSSGLEHTLSILQRQGKVKFAMGKSLNGNPCRVVYIREDRIGIRDVV
jgi:hypothetical protein